MFWRKKNEVYFESRQKDSKVLLIVLAGYKSKLWNAVFDRLKKYVDEDYDVCILTSGKTDMTLAGLAAENGWSYMSTSVNNLCLAQNECIKRFRAARYIFKMDEDMFVTKDVFQTMLKHYVKTAAEEYIIPSAVVPMINVNCITYQMLLRRDGLLKDFERQTGIRPTMTNGLHHHKEVLESPKMAKFMWKNFNIDKDPRLSIGLIPSPGRFSIGLVLFERSTWEEIGQFPVDLKNKLEYKRIGLGEDEKALCNFAMSRCKPILIDTDTLVGHLAYGPQTKEMLDFFEHNKQMF